MQVAAGKVEPDVGIGWGQMLEAAVVGKDREMGQPELAAAAETEASRYKLLVLTLPLPAHAGAACSVCCVRCCVCYVANDHVGADDHVSGRAGAGCGLTGQGGASW
jgi:hypothetical protein